MADPSVTDPDPPAAWHVARRDLEAYLDDRLAATTTASVEAHLLACDRCRRELAGSAAARPSSVAIAEASWAAVERRIDDGVASPAERIAAAVGFGTPDARLVAPTRPLAASWLLATAAALVCAAWLARVHVGLPPSVARTVFLTVAPLAPLVAVVTALVGSSEPAAEIARSTPASRFRIATLRTVTAMGASIALGLVTSTIVPGSWMAAVAWLAPGLALSGLGAVLANRLRTTTVVGGLSVVWVAGVAVAATLADDRLAAFRAVPQWTYVAVAVVCALAVLQHPSLLEPEAVR